jgi:Helix-turn-helix domain
MTAEWSQRPMKKQPQRRANARRKPLTPVRREATVTVGVALGRPRLLLFKEACRYGGFGKSKAYALIREGKIAAFKMDKRTMIDVASIDAFHASLPPANPDLG